MVTTPGAWSTRPLCSVPRSVQPLSNHASSGSSRHGGSSSPRETTARYSALAARGDRSLCARISLRGRMHRCIFAPTADRRGLKTLSFGLAFRVQNMHCVKASNPRNMQAVHKDRPGEAPRLREDAERTSDDSCRRATLLEKTKFAVCVQHLQRSHQETLKMKASQTDLEDAAKMPRWAAYCSTSDTLTSAP